MSNKVEKTEAFTKTYKEDEEGKAIGQAQVVFVDGELTSIMIASDVGTARLDGEEFGKVKTFVDFQIAAYKASKE